MQSLFRFSRNKPLLDDAVNKDLLKCLLQKAGLAPNSDVRKDASEANIEVVLEAQRCLSNIYLQCSRAQNFGKTGPSLKCAAAQS